jgi:hypothetical protein
MNRTALGERDRDSKRSTEHRVELNRPLGLRFVLHQGVGKIARSSGTIVGSSTIMRAGAGGGG